MPLRLYGVENVSTGIEFMIRANSDEESVIVTQALKDQIDAASTPLHVSDFDPPVLIQSTLAASGFARHGPVNGGDEFEEIAPITGFKVAEFDGAAGESISTPDATPNQITTDITLIAWIQFQTYSSGGVQSIVGKWIAGQRGYLLRLAGSSLQFGISTSGNNSIFANSGGIPFADGEGIWVRATRDQSAGEADFYHSDDPKETDYAAVSWTLNTTESFLGTAIHQSTADVQVGSSDGGNVPTGEIARAVIIASDIATDAAANDMFPNGDYSAGSSWESGSANKEIWTLNGNATIGTIL